MGVEHEQSWTCACRTWAILDLWCSTWAVLHLRVSNLSNLRAMRTELEQSWTYECQSWSILRLWVSSLINQASCLAANPGPPCLSCRHGSGVSLNYINLLLVGPPFGLKTIQVVEYITLTFHNKNRAKPNSLWFWPQTFSTRRSKINSIQLIQIKINKKLKQIEIFI